MIIPLNHVLPSVMPLQQSFNMGRFCYLIY
uniref:Uncharacterized protein n=1 Tax=Anguilla anguilla TaxID=7936 RepID=A0A0E9R4S2_ANGAN